ncbi:DUF1330 domain-containing protein [Ovoidimarina sediminis]|uniref:DUF1330 domain-containing protein n=1 Tax=Ovoidimarina sediminis TaxID=3079856 RepID=UPI002912AEFF|nr:DUF1330 domain-containing protein [Rhodophyticola sp. MJ-SS7]MDU8946363.1 DUF1330 domain-containing protein [Rhodophyticola sp. MJ-SS7]
MDKTAICSKKLIWASNYPDRANRKDFGVPKGYLVVCYTGPASEENLAAYATDARRAMEALGGRFIARGLPVKTFEAGKYERSIVIEFESTDAAIRAYEHPSYQAILPRLGVMRDMRVIEGDEPT